MNNSKTYKPEKTNNPNMIPGDPQGSPDESFLNKFKSTLVFIDEAFLSKLSKYLGSGKYLKFDRITFPKNIAKKQNLNCIQAFYYIAPPFQSENSTKEEEERKKGYDNFINELLKNKDIIIREGRCQRLKNKEFEFVFKQKAVDILLTIDLMQIPLKYPNIKKIILISSDSDFVPVIETLKGLNIETILYTYYEKGRNAKFSTSNELIKSVHKYALLTKSDFENAPLKKEEVK
ncbi:NYN domain-containing protein [Candidatus Pacearchaeota archaeon]|nr:NYN domain-containing protein [Candidatus Pacearchaeota archaeon]